MNPSHCKSSQQYLTVCKKYELWMRLHFDMKLTIHKQNQWRQCKVWCASLTLQRPPQLSWELLVNLWPEPEAPETHCLPETENTSSAAARGTLVQRTSAVLHLLWCRTVCRQCSSAPSDLLLSSDTPPPVCSAPAVAAELWPTASSALDPHSSHCESANWPPQLGNIKKNKELCTCKRQLSSFYCLHACNNPTSSKKISCYHGYNSFTFLQGHTPHQHSHWIH